MTGCDVCFPLSHRVSSIKYWRNSDIYEWLHSTMKRTRFLNNTKLNLLFFQFDEGHWPGLVQGLGRVQPYSLQRRSQLPEACRRSQLELYRIVPRSSPRFPSSSASRFTYTGNNSIKFLFRLKNKSLRSFLRITFGKILVVYTCFFEVRLEAK